MWHPCVGSSPRRTTVRMPRQTTADRTLTGNGALKSPAHVGLGAIDQRDARVWIKKGTSSSNTSPRRGRLVPTFRHEGIGGQPVELGKPRRDVGKHWLYEHVPSGTANPDAVALDKAARSGIAATRAKRSNT